MAKNMKEEEVLEVLQEETDMENLVGTLKSEMDDGKRLYTPSRL